ncbi:hypothetical protein Tco_0471251 [Tanacetum coccineum]
MNLSGLLVLINWYQASAREYLESQGFLCSVRSDNQEGLLRLLYGLLLLSKVVVCFLFKAVNQRTSWGELKFLEEIYTFRQQQMKNTLNMHHGNLSSDIVWRQTIPVGDEKSRDHYCCYARCVRFLERKNISRKGVYKSLFLLLLHREEYMSTADMVKIGGFWVNAAMFTLVLLRIAVNTASTARFKSRYYCLVRVFVLLALWSKVNTAIEAVSTASYARYWMTHTGRKFLDLVYMFSTGLMARILLV